MHANFCFKNPGAWQPSCNACLITLTVCVLSHNLYVVTVGFNYTTLETYTQLCSYLSIAYSYVATEVLLNIQTEPKLIVINYVQCYMHIVGKLYIFL